MRIYQLISKSFAYMAIISISFVVMFIIVLDILKYCFGIDPTHAESQRYRCERLTRRQRTLVIQRFVYVNESSQTTA